MIGVEEEGNWQIAVMEICIERVLDRHIVTSLCY